MTARSFSISLFILLLTILAILAISSRGNPVVVKTNLENLPMQIAGYKAVNDSFPQPIYDVLNADENVYRHYISSAGGQVDLYIGYYGTAKGGRTGHNPYACLPGAGWGIVKAHAVTLKSRIYSGGVKVNYILAREGDTFETVIHWYQTRKDKILSNGIQQNLERFVGRVFYNRNDGAFIRVSTQSDEKGVSQAAKRATFFAGRLLDLLPNYWPVER